VPVTFPLLTLAQGAVRVERADHIAGVLGQLVRVPLPRLPGQPLLHGPVVRDRDLGRQLLHRGHNDAGVRGRDGALGLRCRHGRIDRLQHLTVQRDPRAQVAARPHPGRRLGRADPQQLPGQHRGRPTPVGEGERALVGLGDEAVVERLHPPPHRLERPPRRQDLLVGTPVQIQFEQRLDTILQASQSGLHRLAGQGLAHVFNLLGRGQLVKRKTENQPKN
jgi:hypothetical protein